MKQVWQYHGVLCFHVATSCVYCSTVYELHSWENAAVQPCWCNIDGPLFSEQKVRYLERSPTALCKDMWDLVVTRKHRFPNHIFPLCLDVFSTVAIRFLFSFDWVISVSLAPNHSLTEIPLPQLWATLYSSKSEHPSSQFLLCQNQFSYPPLSLSDLAPSF